MLHGELADGSSVVTGVFDEDIEIAGRLAAVRRRRPPIALIAGGAAAAVAIVVVVVVALRGGGGAGDPPAGRTRGNAIGEPTTGVIAATGEVPAATAGDHGSGAETSTPVDEPARVAVAGAASGARSGSGERRDGEVGAGDGDAEGSGEASAATDGAGDGSAIVAPTAAEPAAAHPAPPKRVAAARTLGGKKVVLEYDTAPKATPKQPAKKGDDSASIASARNAYLSGNRRLFAGDAEGAIRLYRQALAIYPGYVAGYRGLGLAYAQKGDKANALRAFRTYIRAVPAAKDVPLIRKRVAALQR